MQSWLDDFPVHSVGSKMLTNGL